MTNFQKLINKGIKNLRIKYNISQEKFSEKCGISTEGYRNIEHNRYTPKSSTIDKICNTFNLTPIELLQLGLEKSNNKVDVVASKLSDLNDKELEFVSNIISSIKELSKK